MHNGGGIDMATLTISDVKIQLRHDTSQNWYTSNPVLRAGELGFESDTGKSKVGDGSTSWNSLNYLYALPVHTHVGTEIVLTGYSKPNSTSAITVNDTLNQAIGKLEKGLDEKQEVLNVITDEDIASAWGSINPFSGGGESSYVLPVASANTLGGIKVGNNLSIDDSGVLSATDTIYTDFVGSGTTAQSGLVPAPPTTAGTTKFLREDGSWEVPSGGGSYTAGDGIDITNDVISLETASANDIGGIKVGDGLSIDENGVLSTIGGGAGNASGVQVTELYVNDSGANTGNIILSNSYKNYDFIGFNFSWEAESPASNNPIQNSSIVSVQQLEDSKVGKFSIHGFGSRSTHFIIVDDTTFNCTATENGQKISKIYGIKFSKNLSEQMYSNVLYENSSGWGSGSITLSDSLENYDFIQCDYRNSSDPSQYINSNIFDAKLLLDGRLLSICGYSSRYFNATVTSSTVLTLLARGDYVLTKITGYKLAKGGYSGIVSDARMTVKSGFLDLSSGLGNNTSNTFNISFDSPMPDADYVVLYDNVGQPDGYGKSFITAKDKTANGFTFFIWQDGQARQALNGSGFSWIAIRPNSYTREGMVEDVLYTTSTGFTTGTINLSGNISDYDLIEFVIGDSTDGEKFTNNRVYSSSVLTNIMGQQNKFFHLAYYGGGWQMLSVDSDNQLSCSNRSGNTVLYKITGIKFGRYVSGVAVDTTVTENSDAVITSGAVYDALQNIPSGGGGSSITVDSTITQGGTNPVEGGAIYDGLSELGSGLTSLSQAMLNKQDRLTFDTTPTADSSNPVTSGGVYTALQNLPTGSGDVTTNTDQNITGTKTFVGSKKVGFKQSTTKDKLGFTLYGNTGTERGYLEFNPTNTVDGVTGLMTLGNYATSAAGLTQVGFRRYSSISGANGAYNLLMPLIADAKSPFNLTTNYTNFYLLLGVTDGTIMTKVDKRGILDLSAILNAHSGGGGSCPVGTVQAYAGNTVPNGWLLCDGSAVSRTDYADLYAVIGDTYGAGDGTSTFNLPNLVDKFVEGSATAGTEKQAGLPNIEGYFSIRNVADESDLSPLGLVYNTNGAVSYEAYTTTAASIKAAKDYGIGSQKVKFSASDSNAIYGNGNTVQPPSITMQYIIKV